MDRSTPLVPTNAVAAIVVVSGHYLLQLRDVKRGIFFPGQWGCFGGALEPGEAERAALVRELREELGLELAPEKPHPFTRFDIDFGFAGRGKVFRAFYEIELTPAQAGDMSLGEGAAMQLFDSGAILKGELPVTPFDSFALWLHINRARLGSAEQRYGT